MRIIKRSRVLDYSEIVAAMCSEVEVSEQKIKLRIVALVKKEYMREVKESCYAYVP